MVEPDLFFVSKDHFSTITERSIQGVPDLLGEVLSPETEFNDRRLKFSLHGRFGVFESWIVDPESPTVQALRRVRWPCASPLELRKDSDRPFLPEIPSPLTTCFPDRIPPKACGSY